MDPAFIRLVNRGLDESVAESALYYTQQGFHDDAAIHQVLGDMHQRLQFEGKDDSFIGDVMHYIDQGLSEEDAVRSVELNHQDFPAYVQAHPSASDYYGGYPNPSDEYVQDIRRDVFMKTVSDKINVMSLNGDRQLIQLHRPITSTDNEDTVRDLISAHIPPEHGIMFTFVDPTDVPASGLTIRDQIESNGGTHPMVVILRHALN